MSNQQGRIKYWNSSKGYGFIARDQDDDVFVHISQLPRDLQPQPGLAVRFTLKQDFKGRWQAQNVQPLDQAEPDTKPATPLQRLWRLTLTVAAVILASFILIKSITPFYSLDASATADQVSTQTNNPMLPGSPHANNLQLQQTLRLILQGGPYPYRQDNGIFHNRERLLPQKAPGYYREYTVTTPGAPDRSTRRVVTGGNPPEIWYYTEDHYRSFVILEVR